MLIKPGTDEMVLITGGSSGLGLEIVRIFLENGYDVICTGRQPGKLKHFNKRLRFVNVDFCDLADTYRAIGSICKEKQPALLICNAGILSPPVFTKTDDGFEITFQVNFLAHLLIAETIIWNMYPGGKIRIASITSPVYAIPRSFPGMGCSQDDYRPLISYSNSKLLIALMGKHLEEKYSDREIVSFSVDPGVFSSAIYRSQGAIFRRLYRIASPFMRKPSAVANFIFRISTSIEEPGGRIFDTKGKEKDFPSFSPEVSRPFWQICDKLINMYAENKTTG
jgi:NAD(P)-dependent dehydrogenase (short-subunit alcohol dehydrogenase family)